MAGRKSGSDIHIYELESAVLSALSEYTKSVSAEIDKQVGKTAKELKNAISRDSPKDSGGYRKSWKIKNVNGKYGNHAAIIYNTNPRIPHLLEKGHAKRSGGRVKAIPHIAPNERLYTEDFARKVEEIIKNGS